ncbi:MAG: transporter substrate-binding domain-containing protein [Clostridiaceae bacterium]|nr:transporter substrate-binding domain-containing protein [Clostridiaceae bacterium]
MKKFIALLTIFIIIISCIIFTRVVVSNITLTEDELAFMKARPVIRLGVDPKFVPFEFIDNNGEYKGIVADYLSLVSEKTGLQFEVVKFLTWPETYEMALSGDVDALSAIGKTEEREEYFLFSKPYYYFKRVIVTRDTDTEISDIDDLEGFSVAVQRNSSHHSYLLTYPQINLSLYDSVEAALVAVATGEEKAFIGNLTTTNYLIRSHGMTNLRFVSFEAEKDQAIYFAVRKDLPELVHIFDKAMDSITDNEKIAINNKWIELDTDVDYGPVIRILAIVGSLIAIVLGVSFFWIVRLKEEVRQRKKIQLNLEKAKSEADEANQLKSSFLARMSHEIRTPLNAITGMSYLLKKTEVSLSQRMYIVTIEQAAKNMLSIINDILDFSKIEAGKVELEITSFNMDQVIHNVVNIISYKIEEQRINFRLNKDSRLPNWFFGDSKRIEQVLLNILNNAVKFTRAGEVLLDIGLVSKENDKYHLSFTVKDTGIGMSEEQIENLFKPFIQGDSSINRRFGGSGLGLSIVKNIVDLMGGQIEIHSKLGEGSTFIIYLKLNIDEKKENIYKNTIKERSDLVSSVNKEIVPAKHDKTYHVLLAEDNKTNQFIVKTLLQQAGIEPVIANDGKEAVELYMEYKENIDLILMDLHMPVINGYVASEKIRKISENVPIVAMTADVISSVREKCEKSGINHYISKPFKPDHFISTINSILSKRHDTKDEDISILDQTSGLKNMGNNLALYKQVINEYFKENKDIPDKLATAIYEKRYKEAAQMVHKIRSSSGSIGANKLYDTALALQEALDEEKESEIIQLQASFTTLLKRMLENIKEFIK